jgi:hypothetical protein
MKNEKAKKLGDFCPYCWYLPWLNKNVCSCQNWLNFHCNCECEKAGFLIFKKPKPKT